MYCINWDDDIEKIRDNMHRLEYYLTVRSYLNEAEQTLIYTPMNNKRAELHDVIRHAQRLMKELVNGG